MQMLNHQIDNALQASHLCHAYISHKTSTFISEQVDPKLSEPNTEINS